MPRLHYRYKRFTFDAGLGFVVLVCCMLLIMLRAGFWQLSRAEQKLSLQESLQAGFKAPVEEVAVGLGDLEEYVYRRIRLHGKYLDKHFLLDNRYRVLPSGVRQIGYEVLTPFELSGGQVIIVNRGWLPAEADRRQLPKITITPERVRIDGTLTVVESGFRMGAMDTDELWPRRLLYVDLQKMGDRLQQRLYPGILMLAEGQSSAYRADWQPVVLGPAKHYGYAAQWFLMSFAVVIMFGFYSIKRDKDD